MGPENLFDLNDFSNYMRIKGFFFQGFKVFKVNSEGTKESVRIKWVGVRIILVQMLLFFRTLLEGWAGPTYLTVISHS